MKTLLCIILVLLFTNGFSQKATPKSLTIKRSKLVEAKTFLDLITDLPANTKILSTEITLQNGGKLNQFMSKQSELNVEVQEGLKKTDLKSNVYIDLMYLDNQTGKSKKVCSSYALKITED